MKLSEGYLGLATGLRTWKWSDTERAIDGYKRLAIRLNERKEEWRDEHYHLARWLHDVEKRLGDKHEPKN